MAQPTRTSIFAQFDSLRDSLKKIVFDQDEAVNDVVDAFIHLSCKPLDHPPRAIFTFLGPPSVGKIFFARTLASFLEDYTAFKQFDMEQYSDPESVIMLFGQKMTGDGMVEGEFTAFVREHPRSVILFDSIDLADNQVQLALLKMLTGTPQESGLDCGELIVIFTSTLACTVLQSRTFRAELQANKQRAHAGLMDTIACEKKAVFDSMQAAIAPKLLSALARSNIILFQSLSLDTMARIAGEALAGHSEQFAEVSGIRLAYDDFDRTVRLLTLTFAPQINVKKIKQKLPDLLFARITDFIRDQRKYPQHVLCKLSRQAVTFIDKLFAERDTLPRRLFKKRETLDIDWKESWRGRTLTVTISRAELKRIPESPDLLRDSLPVIEFSELSFSDIAGNKTVKRNLRQVVKLLKTPELVDRFGIDMPKGMLLHGPPGVGKTMLAKAFAREAERPFVYVARSDLFDPYCIKHAFAKAREYAPSIVFLDGIDIKGMLDGGGYASMPDEQLILELDSLSADPEESVFTIATAQKREDVSPNIIAPDRIDTFVEVPELDRDARRFFIEKILAKPNDGKINVERVIRYISGMSGYDLQRIGKEAALYAIRNGIDVITEEILIEQINIIKYGFKLEKKHIRNLEQDLKITAYHEAGHAVLSHLLLPDIKIEQVTIAPRLRSMGFISYSIEDFPGNICRDEVFNNICVLLGGRLASIRKFGAKGNDTGASNDLEVATHQAYAAVASLGMDEEIGYVHTDTLSQNVSRQIFLGRVEARVMHWMRQATDRAEELIGRHWQKVEELADILIRQEIVDGAELEHIMKGVAEG